MTLFADGHFTFTPTPEFSGISTFTYQAVDPSGARSELTTVQITVSGGNVVTWHNSPRPFDVNNDGSVAPIDALQIINDLNANGSRQLPTLQGGPPYVDTNNDGFVTPIDVLLVVNDINSKTGSPEGEGTPLADNYNSFASSPITVLAAADADGLIGLPSARPRRLSSPMFKVEDGLISAIGTPSATAKRGDAMAEAARRLNPEAGGWSDLLTELASVHRPSSSIDMVLATLDGDSDDLLDDVLNDLF